MGTRGEELLRGTRVLLISAIARPGRFRESAEALGLEVVDHMVFPDHHRYPDSTLERIATTFGRGYADVVVATSKDRVKVQGRLTVPMAELGVTAEPEAAFRSWLEERLKEIEAAAVKGLRP